MKLVTWKSWVVKNQQSRSVPHSKWPLLILFYALGGGAVLCQMEGNYQTRKSP